MPPSVVHRASLAPTVGCAAVTSHLGLDLGGTNIKWVVLDQDGTPLADGSLPTEAERGPDHVRRAPGAGRARRHRGRRPDRDGRRRRAGDLRRHARHHPLLHESPRAVGGPSAGRAAERGARRARAPDQRRARLHAGRGARGGGPGLRSAGRSHARHRRRRRHRARRPPRARLSRHGGRDRAPGDRLHPGRAAMRLRQHRLPRGVRRAPRRWRAPPAPPRRPRRSRPTSAAIRARTPPSSMDRLPRDRPREPRHGADARSHRARRRRRVGGGAHHRAAARAPAHARAPDRPRITSRSCTRRSACAPAPSARPCAASSRSLSGPRRSRARDRKVSSFGRIRRWSTA